MKYRRKPPVVEAITFAEFIEYGKSVQGANIVNGMPWSFMYRDAIVTHENNSCYLISTKELENSNGVDTQQRFERYDILVTNEEGRVRVMKQNIFIEMYEPVS